MKCPECKGVGKVPVFAFNEWYADCQSCHGTGELRTETNAQKARNDGMERTRIKNRKWLVRAMDQVRDLQESVEWTGEGIRLHIRGLVGDPSHHNLWGVLVRDAIGKGLLERTGKWTNMELESSHARCNPVYRVTASRELERQIRELDLMLDTG